MEILKMPPHRRPLTLAVLALVLSAVVPSLVAGQSINYRAQGHYYSAKSALEAGNFSRALQYVYQSREALGGTNQELQYIHVRAAYGAGRYEEAQTALAEFFELAERRQTPIHFDRSVDRLTTDEIRAITQMINPVDERVIAARERRQREEREAREREARERQDQIRREQLAVEQRNRERQNMSQEIVRLNANADDLQVKGFLKLVLGIPVGIVGGLIAVSELDSDYGDDDAALIGLGVGLLGALGVWSGLEDLGEADRMRSRAAGLTQQLRSLSVAPGYSPETRAFQIAARIRF
jgi:hypothetical protein